MGLGVVFANQLVKFDAKAQEDLDKILLRAKEANERRYFGKPLLSLPFCIWIVINAEFYLILICKNVV